IRDFHVTGVQTCALPIYRVEDLRSSNGTFVNGERIDGPFWLKPEDSISVGQYRFVMGKDQLASYDDSNGLKVDVVNLNKWVRPRSEERRVGKECSVRWWP